MMMNSDNKPWYRLDPFAPRLSAAITSAIQGSESDRRDSILDATLGQWFYERDRYRGSNVATSFSGDAFRRYNQVTHGDTVDPAFNLVKSTVDKMVADFIRTTPELTVDTDNGRFEDRRQDAIRSRLLLAMMSSTDFRTARRNWIRDGFAQRVGFMWPRYVDGSLTAQRLHHYQVYWDCRSALDGKLKDMHVVELIDREDFIEWYERQTDKNIPDKSVNVQKLREMRPARTYVPGVNAPWVGLYQSCLKTTDVSDTLRVVWSWRKSSRIGEPNGRAVVSVISSSSESSLTLIDRPFSRTSLPVLWWAPWQTSQGVDGISLGDLLIPTQLALSHVMHRVAMMMRYHGAHKLIIPQPMDATVAKQYADAGFQVIWDPNNSFEVGVPRDFKPYQLDPSDMAYINFLLTQPTEIIGISKNALGGSDELSPSASGIARLQAKFQAQDRQMSAIDAYTVAHKSLGNAVLNEADDALLHDKTFRVSFRIGGGQSMKPWAEYALANDARSVSIAEVGILGSTPAGQIQQLQELAATGAIPNEIHAAYIAEQPDVQRVGSLVFAPRRAIEMHLSILSDLKAEDEWPTAQPTEDMDLALAITICRNWINLAIEQRATDDTLSRLRAYLLAVQVTLQASAPTPPPPGVAQPAPA